MADNIETLRDWPEWYLLPTQVAPILKWDPQYIRIVARTYPERLPFEVVVHGTRTQIPKKPFFDWYDSTK